MGKTLFTRIFLTMVLVLAASSFLCMALLYSQLGTYAFKTQSEVLVDIASHAAELTGQILSEEFDEESDETARWIIQKNIDMQSRNNNCTVVVLNSNAGIILSSGSTDYIDLNGNHNAQIDKALQGKSASDIVTKSKNGVGMDCFVAAEPFYVENNGEKMLWGAVVVYKPMPEIRQTRSNVMRLILMSQIISILIAFLVSFVLARSIARPISKLNSAAKAVAAGDFTKKIDHKSKDEIGELIASFNHMTDALREIDDTRSNFVSNVSHELRTPMTIISGFVEGIVDGTISEEESGKYLSIVLSESRRLSRLVTELLETSRLESGKTKLVMKPVNINEMLRKGIISYEQAITNKKIDVEAEFMYEDSYALCDEDSIYRVIINLMDNAIKFTPEGGVIRIKSALSGRKVEVSIENTGQGISEKDLSHIWERFYKTDRSRGMDKKGVGLGLYLVKTIINQHNNRIWAESKEGEYTRFTFTLDKANVKEST